MSNISTHILDTSRGEPAAGIVVALDFRATADTWTRLADAKTDSDGRIKALLPAPKKPEPGIYRLRFETGAYFAWRNQPAFFPYVEVVFTIQDPARHHHVPLLLNPFGYSTYRGT
jgi:5-hydroxyisourate hydrolase